MRVIRRCSPRELTACPDGELLVDNKMVVQVTVGNIYIIGVCELKHIFVGKGCATHHFL